MNIMSKLKVPSSYGLGMVKKCHVRGNRINKRQQFSIACGKTGTQRGCEGTKKEFKLFLGASYIILANIKLFAFKVFHSFLSSAKVPRFYRNKVFFI